MLVPAGEAGPGVCPRCDLTTRRLILVVESDDSTWAAGFLACLQCARAAMNGDMQ